MEADFGPGWEWKRLEEWSELLVNVAKRDVVEEERFVDFCQSFQNRAVAGQILAHFDKGANNIDTHGDSARTVENCGGHKPCPVKA